VKCPSTPAPSSPPSSSSSSEYKEDSADEDFEDEVQTKRRSRVTACAPQATKKSSRKRNAKDKWDSDASESSSPSSSFPSDSDDSDFIKRSKKKKAPVLKKKAPPPPKPKPKNAAERKEYARLDKEDKERYIVKRQSELKKERADQAKRRLEFLLKQSDIFGHFGNVKEDKEKFHTRRNATGEKSVRRDSSTEPTTTDTANPDADEENPEEEQETIYLTKQPTYLVHGKLRSYQLEGLNWMIRLQENGVNGILADEMGLGKTLQSISILVYMMEYRECFSFGLYC